MTCKLKISYGVVSPNETLKIYQLHERFVTVLIGDSKVDFGYKEIDIEETPDLLFNMGRMLAHTQTDGFVMRDKDIEKAIRSVCVTIPTHLKRKAYHHFLFHN